MSLVKHSTSKPGVIPADLDGSFLSVECQLWISDFAASSSFWKMQWSGQCLEARKKYN